jgi:micrococcal nuclease
MQTEQDFPIIRHRRRRRQRGIMTLLGILIALVLGVVQVAPDSVHDKIIASQPGLWHVTKAVDGDTLNVQMGDQKETVRLLGIDTPETHDPRKPVQCFGEVAAAHTKALVEGKDVRLEPDPTDSDRDKYHRLLRYVYLPDGTLVNAELIKDGYAFAYTIFPLIKLDEFRALEADARAGNRGLWAGCAVDESSDIKQTTSTNP